MTKKMVHEATATSPVVADLSEHKLNEFLAARGGPFYELQVRLGVLRKETLSVVPRAVGFVALTFGVPLLLSIFSGLAWGNFSARPFLLDPATWAKFFLAIGAFVLTELHLEQSLRWCLQEFTRAPVLSPSSYEDAAIAVNTSLERRNSSSAELVCFLAALAIGIFGVVSQMDSTTVSWAVQQRAGDGGHLTAAGWWAHAVSIPILWFLLFRILWRHLVWSLLLRKLATLRLRIVVSHPDGHGGLGFIGRYPNAYALFIFGASCIVAAAIARQMIDENITVTAYGYIMAAWLGIVLALFAFPLSAFAVPLAELKRRCILVASAQATRFHRFNERKIFGSNIVNPEEAEGAEDVADSSKHFDIAKKLSVVLVSRTSLLPVTLAALLPLVAAGATKMPYKEIWTVAKKLLLL